MSSVPILGWSMQRSGPLLLLVLVIGFEQPAYGISADDLLYACKQIPADRKLENSSPETKIFAVTCLEYIEGALAGLRAAHMVAGLAGNEQVNKSLSAVHGCLPLDGPTRQQIWKAVALVIEYGEGPDYQALKGLLEQTEDPPSGEADGMALVIGVLKKLFPCTP